MQKHSTMEAIPRMKAGYMQECRDGIHHPLAHTDHQGIESAMSPIVVHGSIFTNNRLFHTHNYIPTPSICQSIDQSTFSPYSARNALTREKCLQPKNPANADSGLGCGASRTRCLVRSIKGFLLLAFDPHKRKTIGFSLAERRDIT